jgi:hypothetical protein
MKLTRFSLMSALIVAATLSLGGRANATFSIAVSGTPANTAQLTFLPLNLAASPLPTAGTGYQFLTVQVANSPGLTVSTSTPYTFSFVTTDNGPPAVSAPAFTVSGTFNLNLVNGTGTLNAVPNPGTAVPTTFTLNGNQYTISNLFFSGPTLSGGSTVGQGVFSMTITASPVPEPASFVMMGLGIGIGGLMLRRRMAVKV